VNESGPLPGGAHTDAAARTELSYRQYPVRSGGIWAVDRVRVVSEATREPLGEDVEVELDPNGDGRNYTGCPEYCTTDGKDVPAGSGDTAFSYTTRFSTATMQLWWTYNCLHQLTREVLKAKVDGSWQVVRDTIYRYD
jgi:hypothetical protein